MKSNPYWFFCYSYLSMSTCRVFFFFFLIFWTMLPEHVQNWFSFKFAQRSRYVVIFLFLGFQRSSFIVSTVSVSGLYSPYSFVGNPVSSLALVNILHVSKLTFYPLKHLKLCSACWKHFFPPRFSPSPKIDFSPCKVPAFLLYKLRGYVYLFRAHYCVSVYFSGSNTPIFSESQRFLNHIFVMKIFSFHSWNILSLQCCVRFGCTAKRFHYTYIFQILFPYTLLPGTQHRFLFYTEGPC